MKEETVIVWNHKNKGISDEGKLLLLCDGSGKIVFAHGDSSLLYSKIDDLREKHFFSLGFSQYTLLNIKKQAEGGILEPPKRRKNFDLEMVKLHSSKITFQQFYAQQHMYLSRIQAKCSLVRVKFNQDLICPGASKIIKEPINLLSSAPGEHFLTLIEISRPSRAIPFKTSYEDYILSCNWLQNSQKKVKIEEKQ